jgi:hypothetical protein
MAHKTDLTPTPVAVFNFYYKLIGIFGSIKEVSRVTGVVRQSIIKAVYGDTISVNNLYLRAIPPDLIIDIDDIGKLTLFEFDKAANTPDRKIYGVKRKSRSHIIMESEYKRNK